MKLWNNLRTLDTTRTSSQDEPRVDTFFTRNEMANEVAIFGAQCFDGCCKLLMLWIQFLWLP
jgi:hypothetical protein